jgi:hypothetical protein
MSAALELPGLDSRLAQTLLALPLSMRSSSSSQPTLCARSLQPDGEDDAAPLLPDNVRPFPSLLC